MNLSMLETGPERPDLRYRGDRALDEEAAGHGGAGRGSDPHRSKVAPLGDPIEIAVKNYKLSLRKKEAEGILLEVEE